ncbi:hypothetical protein AA313_de0203712 [Arthrobotrys entomopaga]|nr:hypothetical protein AA313_de0203712 [Arthrobotrys entomopaga]
MAQEEAGVAPTGDPQANWFKRRKSSTSRKSWIKKAFGGQGRVEGGPDEVPPVPSSSASDTTDKPEPVRKQSDPGTKTPPPVAPPTIRSQSELPMVKKSLEGSEPEKSTTEENKPPTPLENKPPAAMEKKTPTPAASQRKPPFPVKKSAPAPMESATKMMPAAMAPPPSPPSSRPNSEVMSPGNTVPMSMLPLSPPTSTTATSFPQNARHHPPPSEAPDMPLPSPPSASSENNGREPEEEIQGPSLADWHGNKGLDGFDDSSDDESDFGDSGAGTVTAHHEALNAFKHVRHQHHKAHPVAPVRHKDGFDSDTDSDEEEDSDDDDLTGMGPTRHHHHHHHHSHEPAMTTIQVSMKAPIMPPKPVVIEDEVIYDEGDRLLIDEEDWGEYVDGDDSSSDEFSYYTYDEGYNAIDQMYEDDFADNGDETYAEHELKNMMTIMDIEMALRNLFPYEKFMLGEEIMAH